MNRKDFLLTSFTALGGLFLGKFAKAKGLILEEKSNGIKIRQIRNATLVIDYGGKKFLVDPMLSKKGTYPPFPNSLRQDQNNPLVVLPMPVAEIIDGIDAVFFSHLHIDHYDDGAKELIPKGIKIFVQNETDKGKIESAGFTDVEVLTENTSFGGIQLYKTKAQHGSGEILKRSGEVCGIVFKYPKEKTLYIAADTIWYEGVQEAINKHKPEIIVVNGGDNQFLNSEPLIMGKDDVYEVHKAAPKSKIIVSHMEAVNHYTLSRSELKGFLKEKGIASDVLVPDDGELYTF